MTAPFLLAAAAAAAEAALVTSRIARIRLHLLEHALHLFHDILRRAVGHCADRRCPVRKAESAAASSATDQPAAERVRGLVG